MIDDTPLNDSNSPTAQQAKTAFMTMALIHMALISGVVLFGGVVLLQARSRMTFAPDFRNPIILVACVMAVGTILASSVAHSILFRAGTLPKDVLAAVRRYQVFVLIRAAIIEGGALTSAVAALVTANIVPFGAMVLCALTLILRRPSQQEFVRLIKSENGPR
jgi:hypothetical protein